MTTKRGERHWDAAQRLAESTKGPIAGRSIEALVVDRLDRRAIERQSGPAVKVGAMGQNNCDAQVGDDAALGQPLTGQCACNSKGSLWVMVGSSCMCVRRVSTRLDAQVDHLDRDHGRRRGRRHLHAPLGQEVRSGARG